MARDPSSYVLLSPTITMPLTYWIGDLDKPFLLAIEDTFMISGRGTVATGRVRLSFQGLLALVLIHRTG